METKERVINILVEQLGLEETDITEESNLINDIGMDSLDIVEVIMTLEKEFNLHVPDGEVNGLQTVGDLIKKIDQKLQEK